jgi:hypothetical protein
LNVTIKVVEKLVQRLEDISKLLAVDMTVIALAALVVVSNAIFTGPAVEEPVLEAVLAGREWFVKFPNDHLFDGSVVANFL